MIPKVLMPILLLVASCDFAKSFFPVDMPESIDYQMQFGNGTCGYKHDRGLMGDLSVSPRCETPINDVLQTWWDQNPNWE